MSDKGFYRQQSWNSAEIRRRVLPVDYKQTRISVFVLLCLTLATLVLSQNRNALQDRYGSPVGDVYRTSNGLLIKPTFANNTLCAVNITAKDRKMKDAELKPILDELAPKDARGKYVMGTFLDYSCDELDDAGKLTEAYDCGGVSEDYERLNITKWGSTDDYGAADITYYRRGCNSKRPHHVR